MTPKTKQGLMIAAFSLLSVLAVAGWVRQPGAGSIAPNTFNKPGVYTQSAFNQTPYSGATPVAYDVNGRPLYAQPVPSQNAMYSPYAAQNCVEPMGYQTVAYAPASETRYVRTYRERPRVVRTYAQRDRDYVVRKKRSTGKSVAIVAGSAGAGAAIGALAGGGKGAAIGGISGGVAGFVYDRLTHNR